MRHRLAPAGHAIGVASLAAALSVLAASPAAVADDGVLRFEISRPRPRPRTDVVTVRATAERATIVVQRKFGIDGVVIKSVGGKWPEKVLLRYENFPALEGFKVSNGERRASSQLGFGKPKSEPAVPTYPADSKKDEKPLGKVDLPLVRRGKHIEIELPASLRPAKGGTLTLEWVDAYRG